MRSWPEGDVLFRREPGWLGSDDAYSVPLGGDLTLWLFGDTFLGEHRETATFAPNTVAVQAGLDPATATLRHRPGPVFPGTPGEWRWPLDGVRTPAGVLVFLMRVRSTRPELDAAAAWAAEGSLGFFEVTGWDAQHLAVDAAQAQPAVGLPAEGHGCVLGTAVLREGGWTYAYGYRDGTALLARWPDAAVDAADLTGPLWWCGSAGWSGDAMPEPVLSGVPTEFTVHRHSDGKLLLVQIADPFTGVVTIRRAAAPEGPWSEPEQMGAPPEAGRGVLCYAAKAHPELTGPGLLVTYATIALTRAETLADETLYYPRFLALDL